MFLMKNTHFTCYKHDYHVLIIKSKNVLSIKKQFTLEQAI